MLQVSSPTAVLRYIRRKIGALLNTLELTDEQIMSVVLSETLTTYSGYFPYKYKVSVTEADRLKNVDKKQLYKIPNPDGIHIIGIHNIWAVNSTSYLTTASASVFWVNPFDQQLLNNHLSAMSTPTTWDYYPPDMIEIKPNYVGANVVVEVKAIHPPHLRTIEPTMFDYFCQLAFYDVLESIWPLRERIRSLSSPFGQLEMFMTQVESASQERQALLDKFHENMLRSSTAKRIWIS